MNRRYFLLGGAACVAASRADMLSGFDLRKPLTALPRDADVAATAAVAVQPKYGAGFLGELRKRGLLDVANPTRIIAEDMEHVTRGVWDYSIGRKMQADGSFALFVAVSTRAHSLQTDLFRIELEDGIARFRDSAPKAALPESEKPVTVYCGSYSRVLMFAENAARFVAAYNEAPPVITNSNAFVAALLENCLGRNFNKTNVTRWLKEAGWEVPGFETVPAAMPGMQDLTKWLEDRDATAHARVPLIKSDGSVREEAIRATTLALQAPLREIETQVAAAKRKVQMARQLHLPEPPSGLTLSTGAQTEGSSIAVEHHSLTRLARAVASRVAQVITPLLSAPPTNTLEIPAINLQPELPMIEARPQMPVSPQIRQPSPVPKKG